VPHGPRTQDLVREELECAHLSNVLAAKASNMGHATEEAGVSGMGRDHVYIKQNPQSVKAQPTT